LTTQGKLHPPTDGRGDGPRKKSQVTSEEKRLDGLARGKNHPGEIIFPKIKRGGEEKAHGEKPKRKPLSMLGSAKNLNSWR